MTIVDANPIDSKVQGNFVDDNGRVKAYDTLW